MQRHSWSQQDYALLEENVKQYGLTAGCKKTAETIYVSVQSCISKFYNRKYTGKLGSFDMEKEGVKVDHPEKLKDIKVVETPTIQQKKTRRRLSAQEEVELAEYLKEQIGKNPNNLQQVFRLAAKKFGFASSTSIEARWYGIKKKTVDYSKKPTYRKNIGPVFSVVGQNAVINGKNTEEPHVKRTNWLLNILVKWINKGKK